MLAKNNQIVSSSSQIVIVAVDNLRVGGIQRIALDECYSLIDQNIDFQLICFSKIEEEDSILFVDSNYSKSRQVTPLIISGSIFFKIIQTSKILKKINKEVRVVVHSPSLSVIFFLSRILSNKRFPVLLWIHQVLSLSTYFQALKRVAYSNTADCVFFTTKQFELEWNLVIAKNFLLNLLKPKRSFFSRIGIYYKRVLSNDWEQDFSCSPNIEHRIFASRITSWKGISKLLEVIQHNEDSPSHYILMTTHSYKGSKFFENLNDKKIHILTSKTPAHLKYAPRSVHLYPSDYGTKVTYPMSIGLNVLEFLVLGIPSLISIENFLTFPELKNCPLIRTCDWKDLDEIEQHLTELSRNGNLGQGWLTEENLISISNQEHMNEILEYRYK